MDRRYFLKTLLAAKFGHSFSPLVQAREQVIKQKRSSKTIIFLHMNGGPSQIDLYDYKPELIKRAGQKITHFVSEKGQRGGTLLAPISKFSQLGHSGNWASDLLPNINKHIDDMSFIKSMNSSSLLHKGAQLEQFTGSTHFGNPHIGDWINYANFNDPKVIDPGYKLPGFFHFNDPLGTMRTHPQIISNNHISAKRGSLDIDLISKLRNSLRKTMYNEQSAKKYLSTLKQLSGNQSPFLEYSQIVLDSRDELIKIIGNDSYSDYIQGLYKVKNLGENHLVDQLLLAKKLIKLNVPYIQINVGNEEDENSWDHHDNLDDLRTMCKKIDLPIGSFIQDLKNENLLDDAMLVWGGEFGRLPMIEKANKYSTSSGRGHNNLANTVWVMGAGIKKGLSIGETDELSLATVSRPIYYRDLWATLLHQTGIEAKDLRYGIAGSNYNFFKERPRIIKEILV